MSRRKTNGDGRIFYETVDYQSLHDMACSDYDHCVSYLDSIMGSRFRECPFCGSSEIIRKGRSSNDAQRYACKACHRGFIGNVTPYTHIPLGRWKIFSRSYLEGKSIHRCAVECDVSLKTAQRMKNRIVDMLRSDLYAPVTFNGELLIDV